MTPPNKNIDEVMEEYNKLHNIPVDVTTDVTHDEFVAGITAKIIGIKVLHGEPITLVRGFRRTTFHILVMLYLVAPTIFIPLWAYHEGNWWLLLGIPIASLVSPVFGELAVLKGNSMRGMLLLSCILSWVFKGLHSYLTFFLLCAFWGYLFFQIAENAQGEYALQSLIENPELFRKAIADKRIIVIRRRDS